METIKKYALALISGIGAIVGIFFVSGWFSNKDEALNAVDDTLSDIQKDVTKKREEIVKELEEIKEEDKTPDEVEDYWKENL